RTRTRPARDRNYRHDQIPRLVRLGCIWAQAEPQEPIRRGSVARAVLWRVHCLAVSLAIQQTPRSLSALGSYMNGPNVSNPIAQPRITIDAIHQLIVATRA